LGKFGMRGAGAGDVDEALYSELLATEPRPLLLSSITGYLAGPTACCTVLIEHARSVAAHPAAQMPSAPAPPKCTKNFQMSDLHLGSG
jgi:hypothetical protein